MLRLSRSMKKIPAEIDLVPADGPHKGKTLKAIYVVEDKELKLCVGGEGEDRPTAFRSLAGEETLLLTLKVGAHSAHWRSCWERENHGVAVLSDGVSGEKGSGSSADSEPLKIVQKGLRSIDEHDADFFLELLPGPRDRDGLPDTRAVACLTSPLSLRR